MDREEESGAIFQRVTPEKQCFKKEKYRDSKKCKLPEKVEMLSNFKEVKRKKSKSKTENEGK